MWLRFNGGPLRRIWLVFAADACESVFAPARRHFWGMAPTTPCSHLPFVVLGPGRSDVTQYRASRHGSIYPRQPGRNASAELVPATIFMTQLHTKIVLDNQSE